MYFLFKNFIITLIFCLSSFCLSSKGEANPHTPPGTAPETSLRTPEDEDWPTEYGTWLQGIGTLEPLNENQVHALNETLEHHNPRTEDTQDLADQDIESPTNHPVKYYPTALIQALANKGMGNQFPDLEKHFGFKNLAKEEAIERGKKLEAALLTAVEVGKITTTTTQSDLAAMIKKERTRLNNKKHQLNNPETYKRRYERKKKAIDDTKERLFKNKVQEDASLAQYEFDFPSSNFMSEMSLINFDPALKFNLDPAPQIHIVNHQLSGLAKCNGTTKRPKLTLEQEASEVLANMHLPTELHQLLEELDRDTEHSLTEETRIKAHKLFRFKKIDPQESLDLGAQLEQAVLQEITRKIKKVQNDPNLEESEKQTFLYFTKKEILEDLDTLIEVQKKALMTRRISEIKKRKARAKNQRIQPQNLEQQGTSDQAHSNSENK